MAAVPKRAQNYIPIPRQNKNRMKFAAEPKRVQTPQVANLSYIDDRRIQKHDAVFFSSEEDPGGRQSARCLMRGRIQGEDGSAPGGMPRGIRSSAGISPRKGRSPFRCPGRTRGRSRARRQRQQPLHVNAGISAGVVSTILLIAVVFGDPCPFLLVSATRPSPTSALKTRKSRTGLRRFVPGNRPTKSWILH